MSTPDAKTTQSNQPVNLVNNATSPGHAGRDAERTGEAAPSDAPGGVDRTATERIEGIRTALETVTDPEIPVLNVVEMGIIANIRADERGAAVDVTPTFAGCPAVAVMCAEIERVVRELGEATVRVNVVFDPPWTTDRLSESARKKLKAFGLAPPGRRCEASGTPDLHGIACPYCDSNDTELESIFGPTLCRSIHYCRRCLQSFEHFKAV